MLIDPPRWSQVVRTPGAVQILDAHALTVPPEGEPSQGNSGRPGTRLIVVPLSAGAPQPTVDITSSATQAMLEGFIGTGQHIGKHLSYESLGWGARRRDTLNIGPAGVPHLKVGP